jgi:hypothetical protein
MSNASTGKLFLGSTVISSQANLNQRSQMVHEIQVLANALIKYEKKVGKIKKETKA